MLPLAVGCGAEGEATVVGVSENVMIGVVAMLGANVEVYLMRDVAGKTLVTVVIDIEMSTVLGITV